MTDARKVFQLRREGQADQAFELASRLFSDDPDDVWAIRAYGWVLYDKLKLAQANSDQESAGQFAEVLAGLNIGPDDEMLYANVQRLLARQNPREMLLAEATGHDFAGEHEKALELFRKMAGQFTSADVGFHNAYGWCLYKYLKTLIRNQAGSIEEFRYLAEEYFGLTPERPSLLNSLMLMQLLQQFKDQPLVLMNWQGHFLSGYFRPEDFEAFEKDGKKFPGLAERTVQTLAKVLLASGTNDQIEQFQPELDSVLSRFEGNIWLYYYKAKMLVKTGKSVDAEAFLIPVVRQKRSEYWAWALMGEVLSGTDRTKAISCYCKALTCKAEEKYLINTRLSFGKLLQSEAYYREAKTEIRLSIKARLDEGYGLHPSLLMLEQEDWYKNAEETRSNRSFYLDHLSLAESVVFGELPSYKGNLISTYLRPEDHKNNLRARLFLRDHEGNPVVVSVRVAKYEVLKKLSPGDGISVVFNEQEKQPVVEISVREAGGKFDMVDGYTGVVDHVNHEKGITHVRVSKDIDTLIYGSPVYEPGDFVEVRLITRGSGGQTPYETLYHQATEEVPSLQVCQPFSGLLWLNEQKTAGKVQSVFIDKNLVLKFGLRGREGTTIGGLAALMYNRMNNRWDWRALTLDNM